VGTGAVRAVGQREVMDVLREFKKPYRPICLVLAVYRPVW